MVVTDETLEPVHRHIADLERRVAGQSRVVESLRANGGDPADAARTLHHLESALRVAREHLNILMSARGLWYQAQAACPRPAG